MDARRLLGGARVARLATVSGAGVPHLVPITFALDGDTIVTAVDHKPKTTTNLRRIRDIRENPNVCVLADHYADNWDELWWVRADGYATIAEDDAERAPALASLAGKYAQYRDRPPAGPVIMIQVTAWNSWSYA
ncbi:TIGR03668 family PPOX class F420-dependent oxidoreductase [Microtetraspora sp. AC03309]|uniref:TIGR03668 family PPOX class F420-dependent oxidoreductase n=1 Tax=Microtetraspora sp. AC03309 TaxID=2779376 RepID=UPI001E5AA07C|nr:TIGR03668 family PPOX class F420-dependent oxidoreductase [Microtetraspora sp. AC03309]MCC5577715.1 TIGR03668 family PPOX class F420-dependent oxidoreductase [Microtetraspora sp. AC03309]